MSGAGGEARRALLGYERPQTAGEGDAEHGVTTGGAPSPAPGRTLPCKPHPLSGWCYVHDHDPKAGRTLPVPVVNLACSGCGWRGAASSLDGLNRLAREHDDSPSRQHIVTLNPPGHWPEDEGEFDALLTAPARTPSRGDHA